MSLDLSQETIAIVGRNGAGKSTLMKAMVGLLPIEAGDFEVLGCGPSSRSARVGIQRRVGYLPQDFGYVPSFTVREFVEYGAWLKGINRTDAKRLAREALDVVDLGEYIDKKMGRLSGGTRRRAGIAQAIVHEPDFLVLDEPTTGLDPEQRVRFRTLVRSVAEHRTVVLSSHLVEDVRALADTIVVLDQGRVGFVGSVEELEARALPGQAGDSALERGYITVISGMAVTS